MTRKVSETCDLGHRHIGFRSWLCTMRAKDFLFCFGIINTLPAYRSLLKTWSSRRTLEFRRLRGGVNWLRYLESVGSLRNAGCFKDHEHHLFGPAQNLLYRISTGWERSVNSTPGHSYAPMWNTQIAHPRIQTCLYLDLVCVRENHNGEFIEHKNTLLNVNINCMCASCMWICVWRPETDTGYFP